jgi:hypothetical protein
MQTEQFEKFLNQKMQEAEGAASIDWGRRKRQWLRNLAEFYLMVHSFLAKYEKTGKIKIQTSPVSLTEEHIGTYEAVAKTIFVGAEKVHLQPVGTLLMGAHGRVDMDGPAGRVTFILTDEDPSGTEVSVSTNGKKLRRKRDSSGKPAWKVATPPPRVHFIALTPETFFDALTEVANG